MIRFSSSETNTSTFSSLTSGTGVGSSFTSGLVISVIDSASLPASDTSVLALVFVFGFISYSGNIFVLTSSFYNFSNSAYRKASLSASIIAFSSSETKNVSSVSFSSTTFVTGGYSGN
jgi:hypothetical protein